MIDIVPSLRSYIMVPSILNYVIPCLFFELICHCHLHTLNPSAENKIRRRRRGLHVLLILQQSGGFDGT